MASAGLALAEAHEMLSEIQHFDTPADEPGASEHQPRDALDDIDEAVARITDDDIGDRLRGTLRRAGYAPSQHARSLNGDAPVTLLTFDAGQATGIRHVGLPVVKLSEPRRQA